MGDRLRADIDRIRQTADELRRIHDEFDHASSIVRSYRGFLGSGLLADRLDEFSDNWKIHREQLKGSLEKLAGLSKTAADAYDGVDHDLARALRDAMDKQEKGAG